MAWRTARAWLTSGVGVSCARGGKREGWRGCGHCEGWPVEGGKGGRGEWQSGKRGVKGYCTG